MLPDLETICSCTVGARVPAHLAAIAALSWRDLIRFSRGAIAMTILFGVDLGVFDALRLLLAMAVMALAVTALGVTVGSRMRTFEGFGVISNFVVLPLYFLSGGVFPTSCGARRLSSRSPLKSPLAALGDRTATTPGRCVAVATHVESATRASWPLAAFLQVQARKSARHTACL
jgi:hypothetical protein